MPWYVYSYNLVSQAILDRLEDTKTTKVADFQLALDKTLNLMTGVSTAKVRSAGNISERIQHVPLQRQTRVLITVQRFLGIHSSPV